MENLDEFDIKITEEKSDTRTQDQGEKSGYNFLSIILGLNLKHQAIR